MLKLPDKLVPSRVVIKRLPIHTIGNLLAGNPLVSPSVQLTADQLPVVIDLEFTGLPYSGLEGSGSMYSKVSEPCALKEYGWQQAWDFFHSTRSGASEFVIPKDHAAWTCLDGELVSALFNDNTYWWRITDIKESGGLAKIRSFTATIIQGRKAVSTRIGSYGITSGIGRAVNQLVVSPAAAWAGTQEITAAAATTPVATEEGRYTYPEVPGDIPANYSITEIDLVILDYSAGTRVVLDNTSTYKSGQTRLVDGSLAISDGYEYSYQVGKVFKIMS